MDIKTIAAIGMLLVFPFAIFVFVKMMYHFWYVATGIRGGKTLVAGLLGPFALLVPSLFDERAQLHLRRLGVWLPASIVLFAILYTLQWVAGPAQ
jgi:hypothetical protein